MWLFAAFSCILLTNIPSGVNGEAEQQLQCYACGLPKVHPENDIVGSYGTKIYNHSCDTLMSTIVDGVIDDKFIRTCPVGVKSCFGATGFYDHDDNKPANDIWVRFLGCSEAKYKHDYGCDRELQNVNVRDKSNRRIQVEIDVNLCFCSQHLCNHPNGELLSTSSATSVDKVRLVVGLVLTALLVILSSTLGRP